MNWFFGRLFHWSTGSLVNWFTDSPVQRPSSWFNGPLVRRPFGRERDHRKTRHFELGRERDHRKTQHFEQIQEVFEQIQEDFVQVFLNLFKNFLNLLQNFLNLLQDLDLTLTFRVMGQDLGEISVRLAKLNERCLLAYLEDSVDLSLECIANRVCG